MSNKQMNQAFLADSSQMSSQEFQQMLYTWCEEKGLVADLRSYLRVLMIKKLRNTAMGRLGSSKTNVSLSKQALHLVIGEHLLREGCHYTLSIFSTEVPGIASYLPFSLFEAHRQEDSWRFDKDCVSNVLELIGISKTSTESLRILGLYFKNFGSLLDCLISAKSVEAENKNYDIIRSPRTENITQYIEKILENLGLPQKIIDEVKNNIIESLELEKHNVKTQEKHHYMKIINNQKKNLGEKDQQLKILIQEQLEQKTYNKKLKNEIKEARQRLNQTTLKEQSLKMREKQIENKLDEISQLGSRLKESYDMKTCTKKHCGEQCEAILKLNEQTLKEIETMRINDHSKTLEMERLNGEMTDLFHELHESKVKIEFLHSCLLNSNQLNLQQSKNH